MSVRANLLNWIKRPSPTDWLVAAFTMLLLWVAARQTNLLSESNKISGSAAAAAESAAKAAEESVNMAKAGEATTEKTAEATQATANAAKATAEAVTGAAQAAKESVELTRQANETAENAAKAASRAAAAAENSNTIASDTAKKQLRAYVTPSIVAAIEKSPNVWTFKVQGKNSGQTLANDVVITSDTLLTDFPFTGKLTLNLDPSRHISKMVCGPGNEFEHSKDFTVDQNTRLALQNGTKAIWYFGDIRYLDVYDVKHVTEFRCIIGGNTGATNMVFAKDGNTAN